MVIKASAGREIDALVKDLASEREVAREAAVARLAVIGPRAVTRLSAAARDAALASPARIAALRALEAIRDPRGADVAVSLLGDADAALAAAAINLARACFKGPHEVALVDHVAAVAVDRTRPAGVRIHAVRALQTLTGTTIAPLLTALTRDPDPEIAALAAGRASPANTARAGQDALAAGRLPDDPAFVRQAMSESGAALTLPALHQLVERIREREAAAADVRRAEWIAARGAVHAALAARNSRLALYDLREALEGTAAPLPVDMLNALTRVGDVSCLEPIAAAWSRVPDDWWRRHLADAFQAIVARERIARRNAAVSKIEKRWPQALAALWRSRRAGRAGRAGGAGR